MHRKFKLSGGRAGTIRFREGDAIGELEWEMLVGELDMAIYPRACRWIEPQPKPMTRDEVHRLAAEFAAEAKLKLEIVFDDGSERVPSDTER